MKTLRFFAAGVIVWASLSISSAQTTPDYSNDQKYEDLARKLVTECTSVKEGEIVLITGSIRDNELLEDIVVNVRKQGAFPLLVLGSDRMTRRIFTEVPVKYDTQTSVLDLKLFDMVNTVINVETNVNPGILSDIPPERFIAVNKAAEPVNELILKKSIKMVGLGNGLYPTEAKSKQYGITFKELSDLFWSGLNVDYQKLQATGNNLKSVLTAGNEMHITNANGTDLKVSIESRQVIVSDGIILPENLGKGTVLNSVFLPAGEVYLSPVPGTAEGKIVVDNVFHQDKEINGLTLIFSKGKLVSMTAKSGLEPFKAYYDAGEAGKDDFSVIDFGINPNVKVKPGSKFINWIPAGMLTVGIGNNAWLGGANQSAFAYNFFIPGCTVELDGKVLVDKGNLKF